MHERMSVRPTAAGLSRRTQAIPRIRLVTLDAIPKNQDIMLMCSSVRETKSFSSAFHTVEVAAIFIQWLLAE